MNRATKPLPVGPLKSPKANKYGVSAPSERRYGGTLYASKAEAICAREWDNVLNCYPDRGIIVAEQPVFHLGCHENVYKADFLVRDLDGNVRVVEVTGHATAKKRHDIKLWQRYGPCPLHILTRKGDGWETEIVNPEPKGHP